MVVVPRSRPLAAALVSAALGAWPLQAHAAETPAPATRAARAHPRPSPPPQPPEVDEESTSAPTEGESYRGALTASYVMAPLLALGVGGLLSGMEVDDTWAVLGGTAMFLAPAAVHMGHGNVTQGPVSFLLLAGATGAGVLLGGLTGYYIDSADCDPAQDSDGCDFAGFTGLVAGALIGGVGAYTGYAIYDVSENGALPLDESATDEARLELWLSPVATPSRSRGEARPFDGVQLGARLVM
jgi:hypothetical protein